jgi:hypothetical protein
LNYSTSFDIRYREYAEKNSQEFWYYEMGGIYYYSGFHFKELIKRFPESELVDDAAYELTKVHRGGECEGWMDCYIEYQFNQVKEFLELYPNSEHAEEAVKRANEAFLNNLDSPLWVQNFGAIKDYAVAQESYEPQAIQQTLAIYETIAETLPLQLRAKAYEAIAGLWVRFKQLDRAIRLYSFIVQQVSGYENVSVVRKQLSALLPEAQAIRFVDFYDYLVKLNAELLDGCGDQDLLTINEIEFADLDHDGQEEAVVEATTCGMGTGVADITEVFKLLDKGELTALKINNGEYENLYEGSQLSPRLNVQNGRLIRWYIMFPIGYGIGWFIGWLVVRSTKLGESKTQNSIQLSSNDETHSDYCFHFLPMGMRRKNRFAGEPACNRRGRGPQPASLSAARLSKLRQKLSRRLYP